MKTHKIVILGSMGAGKSTLVRAVAQGQIVDTDVDNTDIGSEKLGTTVAMDYADLALPSGERLRLFGSPGQARFSFIWPILLEGAVGVIVLVDASLADPLAELDRYLDALDALDTAPPVVVGLSKIDLAEQDRVRELSVVPRVLAKCIPLVPIDAREPEDILMLMDILMSRIETEALVAGHA